MNEHKPAEQGLVKARVVEGEIVDASAYNAQVASWQTKGFSVLTPAVSLSSIPRDHKVLVQQVQINPDTAGGEVYSNPLFTRNGEVALSKAGLEKVAQAAGITIDDITRVDSRTVEHVYTYRVTGHWLGFDGNVIARIAHKTLDLRDGSPDIKGFTANQIEQARRHGEAVCESKAINRLYRQYGLRQKYRQQELAERPFIVLKLQWEPDMSNPIVAAIVTQMKMGATNLLFPQGMSGAIDTAALPSHQVPPSLRTAALPTHVEDEDDDPPVNQERSFDEVEAEDAKKAASFGGYIVTGVTNPQGTDDYFVTLDDGRRLHTVDKSVAKVCNEARKSQALLAIEVEKKGDQLEIVEVSGGKY